MGGNQVDAIFMDLAKAFDKINHNILLRKLSDLPLDPSIIVLLQSYLKGRKQFISIHGEKSVCITPNSSVPQGSVLSPLLFALFINDLAPLIKSNILLFADDIKIFNKISSYEDAKILQKDIETIVNWCSENELQLNINKCNAMTFTRKHPNFIQTYNYNINNRPLNRVNSYKDLGIILDSKLNFHLHSNNITSRAYKMLGFISRSLNKFKQLRTYHTLYNTYVRSIIEYGSPIWNPNYNNAITQLERIQKRYTRFIYRKFHYPTESYETRLIRLEMFSLENRRLLTDELVLYKIMNNHLNTSLNESITLNHPFMRTRQNVTFHLTPVTNNVQFFAPILRNQRQHNECFNEIQLNEPNFNAFKRYVSHELRQMQNNEEV